MYQICTFFAILLTVLRWLKYYSEIVHDPLVQFKPHSTALQLRADVDSSVSRNFPKSPMVTIRTSARDIRTIVKFLQSKVVILLLGLVLINRNIGI